MTATTTPRKILVADDEESLRLILRETLEAEGYVVKTARDGQEALQFALSERIDLVLTDIRMPGMSGLQLLEELKKQNPKALVIIMTSHASLESSLEAIRYGAYGYLLKPFPDLTSVVNMVGRAADQMRLVEQNEELIRSLKEANRQLSESNELLASRAATISALLDYSQAISALLTEQPFAIETARAASKLSANRPAVVYKVGREPLELVPMASEGMPKEGIRTLRGPVATSETAIQAWIGEVEQRGEIPRNGVDPAFASAYVKPVIVDGRVTQIVAVFEQMGPFPPSVRAVLDKFMFQVRQTAENIALHESMRALAIRDGLTGLYNHRYFQDRFLEEFSRAKRHKHPLSLIFVDVDHFKKFNDTYGHPKGDALLRALSRLIKGSGRISDIHARGSAPIVIAPGQSRESDIVARYGGEEFVVILVETDREGALVRAERLRKAVADTEFVFGDSGEPLKVTVSVGVAWMTDAHARPDDVVLDADKAMYAAKHGGRNRVCTPEDVAASEARKA